MIHMDGLQVHGQEIDGIPSLLVIITEDEPLHIIQGPLSDEGLIASIGVAGMDSQSIDDVTDNAAELTIAEDGPGGIIVEDEGKDTRAKQRIMILLPL